MAPEIDSILLAYAGLGEGHVAAIQQAAPQARLVEAPARGELAPDVAARVDVALGWLAQEQMRTLPALRWLQQTGAGADWLLRAPAIAASDLILTNASGVHAIPIAEHILALMLTLSRRIHRFVKAQRDHEWVRRGRLGELHGSTIGIVGLGAIGEKTAEKARGLHMRVLGLRRHAERTSPFVDQMYGPEGLHELLGASDWVVLAAALTAETRHLIGEAELRAMKPSAYLINIARGGMIDEASLIRALEEGWIAGAGLDVFEQEPLGTDSPLWDMRNVVLTPHFAGATPHYTDRVIDIFTENLRRYGRGEPLLNQVDKTRGY